MDKILKFHWRIYHCFKQMIQIYQITSRLFFLRLSFWWIHWRCFTSSFLGYLLGNTLKYLNLSFCFSKLFSVYRNFLVGNWSGKVAESRNKHIVCTHSYSNLSHFTIRKLDFYIVLYFLSFEAFDTQLFGPFHLHNHLLLHFNLILNFNFANNRKLLEIHP